MSNVHAVITRPDGSPLIGVKVDFLSTVTKARLDTTKTTNQGGEVTANVAGPFFVRARVTGERHRVLVTKSGNAPCYDYVVDAGGMGTHTTLDGAAGAWAAVVASGTGQDRSIWLCGDVTLTTTLSLTGLQNQNVVIAGPGASYAGAHTTLTGAAGSDIFINNSGGSSRILIQGLRVFVASGFAIFAGPLQQQGLNFELRDCFLDMTGATITTNRLGVNGNGNAVWRVTRCGGALKSFYQYNNGNGTGQAGLVYVRESVLTCQVLWEWDNGAVGFKSTPSSFVAEDSELTITATQTLENMAGTLRLLGTTLIYDVGSALFSGTLSGAIGGITLLDFENVLFDTATAGAKLINVTGNQDNLYLMNVRGYSTASQAGVTFITLAAGATASVSSISAPAWSTVYSGPTPSGIYLGDHGSLGGLLDDDHTIYTLKATLTVTGDVYYASAASTPARLGIGSSGDVLTVAGGLPSWASPNHAMLSTRHNDSTAAAVAVGALIRGNAAGTAWEKLVAGTEGYVLKVFAGIPAWRVENLASGAAIAILSDAVQVEWTNQPAAVTELLGLTVHRTKINLTNTGTVRLVARILTAGVAGAVLRGQYSLDGGGSWAYLDGATGPSLAIDATGTIASATVNLEAAAKADVVLRVVGVNGNATADPAFGLIELQFDVIGGGGVVSPLTTKGDIWVYSSVDTRLPVGTDAFVLAADSSTATGLKWVAGGGAPTTAKYVTTLADGTLSAEVVRQQLGNYFNETYPGSANAMDDEFDDTSGMSGTGNGLNARWAWRNQGGATVTYTKAGWISLNVDTLGQWRIIEQAEPAAQSYTIEAKFSFDATLAVNQYGGIVLVDGTNGDFYSFMIGVFSAGNRVRVELDRWTNVTTFLSNLFTMTAGATTTVYLRAAWDNAGALWTLSYSTDGIGWFKILAAFADAVVVTKVGIGAHLESGVVLPSLHCDYFRRTV